MSGHQQGQTTLEQGNISRMAKVGGPEGPPSGRGCEMCKGGLTSSPRPVDELGEYGKKEDQLEGPVTN